MHVVFDRRREEVTIFILLFLAATSGLCMAFPIVWRERESITRIEALRGVVNPSLARTFEVVPTIRVAFEGAFLGTALSFVVYLLVAGVGIFAMKLQINQEQVRYCFWISLGAGGAMAWLMTFWLIRRDHQSL
jgi:hypothetical protein